MKSFIATSIAAAFACFNAVQAAEFTGKEPGVILLDDNNFWKVANDKKFLLTFFYAPWCDHCTQMEPEIKAAAAALVKQDRYIGVVNGDMTTADKIMKELDIQTFPQLFWIQEGETFKYAKDKDRKSIYKYVRVMSGLEATTAPLSKKVECDEIEATSKKHRYVAFAITEENTQFFNFYQNMQNEFLANRKTTGEDVDMILGKLDKNGMEDEKEPHQRLPKFNYYHTKAECLKGGNFKDLFKDSVVPKDQGAMVIISPGNDPQILQDSKQELGLAPKMMVGFMKRMTDPAFQMVTRFNHGHVINPEREKNIENHQMTILISRNAKDEYAFKPMKEAAIKQKYYMKYYYVTNKKPTRKQTKLAEAAKKKKDDKNKELDAAMKAITDKKITTGVMTRARKENNEAVDEEEKAFKAKADTMGYKYTLEEKEALDLIEEEKTFAWFMKNFQLKEMNLPLIYHYDPLKKDMPPVYAPMDIHMRDVTVDKLVESAEKWIGHYIRPIAKSQPPADSDVYGMAHKRIIGYNYGDFSADKEMETIINHMVDWEPFCKMLKSEYEKLAEVLKEVKGLQFGSYNMEKNDVGFVNHKSFPTIVHFTKTNKRGRKINYINRKSKQIPSLIKYLEKHSDAYKAHMEANPDFDPIALSKTIKYDSYETRKKAHEEKVELEKEAQKKKLAEEKAKKDAEEKAEKEKEDGVVDLDAAEEKPKSKEEKPKAKKAKKAKTEEKAEEKKSDL